MALVPYLWLIAAFAMGALIPALDARASHAAFDVPAGYVFEKPAVCEGPKGPALIYNICADQMAIFTDALGRTANSGKSLVVIFGATWCPTCKSLKAVMPSAELFSAAPGGKPLIDRVAVTEIAISTLENGKVKGVASGESVLGLVLKQRPEVKQRGVPFLAVIDAKSGRTYLRNLGDLEPTEGNGWNLARLADVVSAADIEVRGGPSAGGEPGWLKRKWQRLLEKVRGQ